MPEDGWVCAATVSGMLIKPLLAVQIYTYIHIQYIYTYTHIHIYTYTHIHIYTYTHIHIYVYTYTHIHIYTYIYIYTHIHIYTYRHIHIHIHIYINIYIYSRDSTLNRLIKKSNQPQMLHTIRSEATLGCTLYGSDHTLGWHFITFLVKDSKLTPLNFIKHDKGKFQLFESMYLLSQIRWFSSQSS